MNLGFVNPEDPHAVRRAFQTLQNNLGYGATPKFAGLILTGLTASRLIWTDANKTLASKDLVDLVAGTANEIDVADDGDGSVTIGLVNPLIVGKGGTGAATLTDHSILLGSGTDAFTALGAATNGQLPIGSTGADPVLATITEGTGITVTNGAGTITLATTITQYTDELAQDAVGGILDDGTLGNIVFTYDDEGGTISADTQDGEIDHDALLNTHNLTTDIDHDSLTNTHDLTTDIDHDSITNTHNLTTDIDHDQLTNTHNLTTDIDHDQLTNFVANEHFLQTAIDHVSTALATGLLKATTGTGALSIITDNSSNWDTAFGWGDHSLVGYLTGISGESIGNLSDVDLTDIGADKILQYNNVTEKWECEDPGAGSDNYTVKIDAAATAGYIGAANNDGVLRAGNGLDYADGGDYVTLDVADIGVAVYKDSTQAITTATVTAIQFNQERWDTDGCHDNATNNTRLTAKTAGKYIIQGDFSFATNAAGFRQGLIRLNGTTTIAVSGFGAPSAPYEPRINISCIYNLAFQDSGGNLNVQGGVGYGNFSPEFRMQMIAPV
jgi:hypothetical protein